MTRFKINFHINEILSAFHGSQGNTVKVEEDTDRSLERSTLTIPAGGRLRRGARTVVQLCMASFITWVKDQPIGASEKAWRRRPGLPEGLGALALATGCVYAPCCCPSRPRSHPSDFTITRTVIEAAKCALWKTAGKQWCILEGCTLT